MCFTYNIPAVACIMHDDLQGKGGEKVTPKKRDTRATQDKSYHVRDDHLLLNHGDYWERCKLDKPFSSILNKASVQCFLLSPTA